MTIEERLEKLENDIRRYKVVASYLPYGTSDSSGGGGGGDTFNGVKSVVDTVSQLGNGEALKHSVKTVKRDDTEQAVGELIIADEQITSITYDDTSNELEIATIDQNGIEHSYTITLISGGGSTIIGGNTPGYFNCPGLDQNGQSVVFQIPTDGYGSFSLNRAPNTTIGAASVSAGQSGEASGNYSTALGFDNKSTGQASYSEGRNNTSSGVASHAEGRQNTASGDNSHAEGINTRASGARSHAEGSYCYAEGLQSHAEGTQSHAVGARSHAEGSACYTYGEDSHAQGVGTIAQRAGQFTFGYYNIIETGTEYTQGEFVEIVGNGTDANNRSNCRTLDWNGNEKLAGYILPLNGIVLKSPNSTYYQVTVDNNGLLSTTPIII